MLAHNGFGDICKKGFGDLYRFKKKYNIDLFPLIKKRASAMSFKGQILENLLMRNSLDYITQTLELVEKDTGKKKLDYKLLWPEVSEWTPEVKKEIEEYTIRDLEVTKKLYEWIEEYFESFRGYVNEKDIESKTYLTSSTASFTYKSICNAMGWSEQYTDSSDSPTFGGGYVSYPAREHTNGKIYCLDFNSLYPSIMWQCNIFSPAVEGWNGDGKFKVEGIYNNEVQGDTEKLIKKMYEDRLVFKKTKDPRQYSLKIQINAAYGLLGNPVFTHMYNHTSAADVTRIGRQWVKLARTTFAAAGYDVIYTDTDSVYIKDIFDDKEKMLKVKDNIIQEIKDNIPFPYEKFDMGVDAEITDIWFFKGDVGDKKTDSEMDKMDKINKAKKLIKKNYIYRETNGHIGVKNLGVNKKSLSAISRKLFWDVLVPEIDKRRVVKFSESEIKSKIHDLLMEDLSLAAVRYNIKSLSSYKSKTSTQYSISELYGDGIKFLIPVLKDFYIGSKKITIGKVSKKMLVEDFKKLNLTIDDIDLSKIWKELSYFIKDSQTSLSAFFE